MIIRIRKKENQKLTVAKAFFMGREVILILPTQNE